MVHLRRNQLLHQVFVGLVSVYDRYYPHNLFCPEENHAVSSNAFETAWFMHADRVGQVHFAFAPRAFLREFCMTRLHLYLNLVRFLFSKRKHRPSPLPPIPFLDSPREK